MCNGHARLAVRKKQVRELAAAVVAQALQQQQAQQGEGGQGGGGEGQTDTRLPKHACSAALSPHPRTRLHELRQVEDDRVGREAAQAAHDVRSDERVSKERHGDTSAEGPRASSRCRRCRRGLCVRAASQEAEDDGERRGCPKEELPELRHVGRDGLGRHKGLYGRRQHSHRCWVSEDEARHGCTRGCDVPEALPYGDGERRVDRPRD